mmetsp:Transcript_92116/g.265801  ORF Transcript_92116/g.265801 Transcript_92116/m.265801 type:complete len:253 (-) Transcript_92116:1266-2024(-)
MATATKVGRFVSSRSSVAPALVVAETASAASRKVAPNSAAAPLSNALLLMGSSSVRTDSSIEAKQRPCDCFGKGGGASESTKGESSGMAGTTRPSLSDLCLQALATPQWAAGLGVRSGGRKAKGLSHLLDGECPDKLLRGMACMLRRSPGVSGASGGEALGVNGGGNPPRGGGVATQGLNSSTSTAPAPSSPPARGSNLFAAAAAATSKPMALRYSSGNREDSATAVGRLVAFLDMQSRTICRKSSEKRRSM